MLGRPRHRSAPNRDTARRLLDQLGGHQVLPAGTISLDFDDGYRSAYEHALPLLEARGWPATQYVLAGTPSAEMDRGDSPLMTSEEIRDWARRATIGSHGITHRRLPDLSDQEIRRELAESRETLERVTERPVNLFAAPFGATDARVTAIARESYRSQRLFGGPPNTARSFSCWSIHSIGPRPTTTLAEFQEHLDRARRRRSWLVVVWHRIGEGRDTDWNVETGVFGQQLDAIAASGLEVVGTDVMLDRLDQLLRPNAGEMPTARSAG